MAKICIRLRFDNRNLNCQEIVWPEDSAKSTDKVALLQTPGGEVWVLRSRLQDLHGAGGIYPIERLDLAASTVALDRIMAVVTRATADAPSSDVPVKKVGRGSTVKSARYEVEVDENMGDSRDPAWERRTVRVTLPISQIKTDGSQAMAPKWLFKDKIPKGQKLANTVWPGLPAVRAQIEGVVANAIIDAVANEARRNIDKGEARIKHEAQRSLDARVNTVKRANPDLDAYLQANRCPAGTVLADWLEDCVASAKFAAWRKRRETAAVKRQKQREAATIMFADCMVNFNVYVGTFGRKTYSSWTQTVEHAQVKVIGKKVEFTSGEYVYTKMITSKGFTVTRDGTPVIANGQVVAQ